MRTLWGLRVAGLQNIPKEGGFIIASNHASYLDPPFLGVSCTMRSVGYMAKAELFSNPLFGAFIRFLGAIPIRRGAADRNMFKTFGEALRQRKLGLIVFPEGTRSADGALGAPRRGIGALCREAGVPVVPAYIRGSYEVWPRQRLFPRLGGRIEVRFGNPVEWSDGELAASGDLNGALADLIMKKIEGLRMTEGKTLSFLETFRSILAKPRTGNPTPGESAGTRSSEGKEDARPG